MNFDRLPKYNKFDKHLWADFIEILCCFDPDRQMSQSQYVDWVKLVRKDLEITDSGDEDELFGDTDLMDSDKDDMEVEELFKFFVSRKEIYGELYPFYLKEGVLYLKQGVNQSENQLLYLYLLYCSHLFLWDKSLEALLTSEFEEISFLALQQIISNKATLHKMGKNTLGTAKYQGNLFSKLSQISSDLGEILKVSEEDFPKTNSGDGGLDLLGWVNFYDKMNSKMIFAGQAKCSTNWYDYPSAGDKLRSYFHLDRVPNDLFFIPYCFRRINRNWHQMQCVARFIVLDRSRLMHLLSSNDTRLFAQLNSFNKIRDNLEKSTEVV